LQHDDGYAGGNWNNTSNAGLGYRNANNERSNANNNIGLRPALSGSRVGREVKASRRGAQKKEPYSLPEG